MAILRPKYRFRKVHLWVRFVERWWYATLKLKLKAIAKTIRQKSVLYHRTFKTNVLWNAKTFPYLSINFNLYWKSRNNIYQRGKFLNVFIWLLFTSRTWYDKSLKAFFKGQNFAPSFSESTGLTRELILTRKLVRLQEEY